MLRFERLESRCLLAASIDLTGGLLSVIGDGGANNIYVHGDGNGNIAAGIDVDGNGSLNDGDDINVLVDEDDVRSIRIDSGAGDDVVLVHLDTAITGDLTILTRGGFDMIDVTHVAVGRDLKIETGAGDDFVAVFESDVGRNLTVKTQAGNDIVYLETVDIQNRLEVTTGADDDAVSLYDLDVGSNLTVNLGGGQDLLIFDPVTLGLNPNQLKLNAGGGRNDLMLTDIGDVTPFLKAAGVSVSGFEADKALCGCEFTPSENLRLTTVEFRLLFSAAVLEDWHDIVDDFVFVGPPPI
jgi:hypothetical protein